jgi:hypothetical protein
MSASKRERKPRDYWIDAVDRTHLYYKVSATSAREALEKFLSGEEQYVGCTDECNASSARVLRDEPYIANKG